MTIGERIRKRREQRKISQAELASKLGTSQATIQKIETGETRKSKYTERIYAHLGLPLAELDPVFSLPPAPASNHAELEHALHRIAGEQARIVGDILALAERLRTSS